MDTGFIKDWSVKINIPEDVLVKEYEMNIKEMRSYFPNQSDDAIAEKAKSKLKTDHLRKFTSNAETFDVVVLSYDAPRDNWARIKESQIEIYKSAEERAEKEGNKEIVEQVLRNKVVTIDPKTKEIIPLGPKFKRDGTPSKMFGKELPSTEDSLSQTVYGIATPVDKKEARGMILELRGKACSDNIPAGKILSVSAINKTKPEDKNYMLSTNQTDFIERTNEYLQEGINKFGITGLTEKFFSDYLATWEDIRGWMASKTIKPSEDPIPEKYKSNLMVLKDSLCIYQNFSADDKNRIKINICSADSDIDDVTVLCLASKNLDKSIDFAQNSKVLTIGRPWMPPVEEGQEAGLIIMTSGMFAYPDWKIPRIEAQPVNKEQTIQNKEASEVVKATDDAPKPAEKAEEPVAENAAAEKPSEEVSWN
jgi:hypothetical protein